MICSGWVNAVFIRNDLPELCTDLVAALSSLNVHELTHGFCCKGEERSQTALRVAGGLQDKRHVSLLLISNYLQMTPWISDCMFLLNLLELLSCFNSFAASVNIWSCFSVNVIGPSDGLLPRFMAKCNQYHSIRIKCHWNCWGMCSFKTPASTRTYHIAKPCLKPIKFKSVPPIPHKTLSWISFLYTSVSFDSQGSST